MRDKASSRLNTRWLEDNGWWIGLLLLLFVGPILRAGTPVDAVVKWLLGALIVWSLVARAIRGFLVGWREPLNRGGDH